jgi:ribosomal protein S18 acetylase RimI-like enzyme
MKHSVLIRKAVLADIPRIIVLWKALEAYHVLHHGYGRGIFRYRPDRLALYVKFLKKQLRRRDAAVFVAELGGNVIGHVMVQVNKLPPIYVHDKDAHVCEIVVDGRHRGKGIGTMLLEEAEGWASKKGLYSISLFVHIGNKAAYAAYRKSGFEEHHLKMAKTVGKKIRNHSSEA